MLPLLKPLDAFFLCSGVDWEHLHEQQPPSLLPYLPGDTKDGEGYHSDYNVSIHVYCTCMHVYVAKCRYDYCYEYSLRLFIAHYAVGQESSIDHTQCWTLLT